MNEKWIFIHGGWGGSWQWVPLIEKMDKMGIQSLAPDMPGMGNLSVKEVELTHFIDHISKIIDDFEGPLNIAAFSFGGLTATALAEKYRSRIRKLVYVDAFVPLPGQSFSQIAGEKITRQIKAYSDVMGEGEMIPPFDQSDSRYCSHPLNTIFTPVFYDNQNLDSLNPLYIECTAKDREWTFTPILEDTARAINKRGWTFHSLASDHMPMYSHTDELLSLIL